MSGALYCNDSKATVLSGEGFTNERLYTVVTKLASNVSDKVKAMKVVMGPVRTHTSILKLDSNDLISLMFGVSAVSDLLR